MKKYIKPSIKTVVLNDYPIMAGSLGIGEGDTKEMLSKRNSAFEIEDNEDEY